MQRAHPPRPLESILTAAAPMTGIPHPGTPVSIEFCILSRLMADLSILHKPCQITVKHTEKNGTKFANVDDVLSASQKTDAPF